ncbi:class I SAM-dependent methyltransferase [Streptomyces sp. ODS28]|uniref:class I SAM-dependent methyltransferase n=1 Tax=Streptomyces sp. ODS28 TaxID=3136688 RepID=UPI0031ECC232
MSTEPVEPVEPFDTFDRAYATGTPPWVIGEPQPVVVELERSGALRGAVLDPGCGAGEHTVLLAEKGYDVLGVDFAPHAVELARKNADQRGVPARFESADALRLPEELGAGRFDTVLDSALFHCFGEEGRTAYVGSLYGVTRPGATVYVLALSDRETGFGPRISEEALRTPFEAHPGFEIESLEPVTYSGLAPAEHAREMGIAPGDRVEATAWLARVRRDERAADA